MFTDYRICKFGKNKFVLKEIKMFFDKIFSLDVYVIVNNAN